MVTNGKNNLNKLRILGIDPGTLKTGFGIIEKQGDKLKCIGNGNIKLNNKSPMPLRLHDIFNSISDLIEHYHPDVIAVEDVFLAKNPQTSLKLGQAQGIVLLKAAQAGLQFAEYSTREVKESLTGFGNATKEQVQYMVKQNLNLTENVTEDASDALAVAICHSQRADLLNAIDKAKSEEKE